MLCHFVVVRLAAHESRNVNSPTLPANKNVVQQVAGWPCGRIVTSDGRLVAIQRRLLAYRPTRWRAWFDAKRRAAWLRKDESAESETSATGPYRCVLYYHHGWLSADFLVLSYVSSHPRASLSSFYCATLVLDELAREKGSHAIVAELTNERISDRLMQRWGWERHCLNWKGRHFIKRFYGTYPALPDEWRTRIYRPLG